MVACSRAFSEASCHRLDAFGSDADSGSASGADSASPRSPPRPDASNAKGQAESGCTPTGIQAVMHRHASVGHEPDAHSRCGMQRSKVCLTLEPEIRRVVAGCK